MYYGSFYNYQGIFKIIRSIRRSDYQEESTWQTKLHLACKDILIPFPQEIKVWFMGQVFPRWGLLDECTEEELAKKLQMSLKQLRKVFKSAIKRLKHELIKYPFIWSHLREDARPAAYFEMKKRKVNCNAA